MQMFYDFEFIIIIITNVRAKKCCEIIKIVEIYDTDYVNHIV